MRRALQLIAVLIGLVSLSVGIAYAVKPAAQPRSVAKLGASVHVLRYFENGPGAFCDFEGTTGKCGVAAASPQSFTLPKAASTYSCTLTLSLDYRTVGAARFGFDVDISAAKSVKIVPPSRPLGSTHGIGDTRTLVLRPAAMHSGVKYTLSFDTELVPNTGVKGASQISTSKILADLACSPA